MPRIIRSFLPALAVLSLLVFSGPVTADMVTTPQSGNRLAEARDASLGTLSGVLAAAGASSSELQLGLQSMPTSELLALSSSVDALRSAGYHEFVIAGLILGGIVAAVVVIVFVAWRHRGHHHHHQQDKEPEKSKQRVLQHSP